MIFSCEFQSQVTPFSRGIGYPSLGPPAFIIILNVETVVGGTEAGIPVM